MQGHNIDMRQRCTLDFHQEQKYVWDACCLYCRQTVAAGSIVIDEDKESVRKRARETAHSCAMLVER